MTEHRAWVLRIEIAPDNAIDAFYHPYAYATRENSPRT
jgi:hypothetical protein